MVLGIQLIGIMFAIFMVYLTFLNYKQGKFSNGEWMIWLGAWVIFLVVILFPSILSPLLETLNLYRAMDFYISIGFLFFILLIFNIHTSLKSVQKKVEVIIREMAMQRVSRPRKK